MYFPGKIGHFLENGWIWMINHHIFKVFYNAICLAYIPETSCNKVDHLLWFTILAQHETNDVILYIYSVHKHRGNSFQRQNYKMRLKQRNLNWIRFRHLPYIFHIKPYSHEVIPYLIFMKFSALNAEINIVSSLYNLQIFYFYFLLRIDLKTKFNFSPNLTI
jgi:hypothetical protein